jgi:hypothetical protein
MANVLFENIYNSYGPNHVYGTTNSEYYNKVIDHIDPLGNKIYHGMSSHLASIEIDDKKITIAATPGRSALNLDYNFYEYTSRWDEEGSVVMPWYGYIDIKNWLPQTNLRNYKNTEYVVETYVDKTLEKFKKSEIVFINPMPQFMVVAAAKWANFSSDPDIQFEDRYSYHLEFTNLLKQKCESEGLKSPINISDVLGNNWIEPVMQFKKPINLSFNDHLKPEYYDKILSSILDTAFNV